MFAVVCKKIYLILAQKQNVRAVRKNVCVKEKHDRAIKIGYIFGQRRTNKRTERCALNLMSRRGENNLGEHRKIDGSSEHIWPTLERRSEVKEFFQNYLEWWKQSSRPPEQPDPNPAGRCHHKDSHVGRVEQGVEGHRPGHPRSLGPVNPRVERARHEVVNQSPDQPQDRIDGGDRKVEGR